MNSIGDGTHIKLSEELGVQRFGVKQSRAEMIISGTTVERTDNIRRSGRLLTWDNS
jgi:hypothetical protein